MKRRLVLALVPATFAVGLVLHGAPARASAPAPKIAVNTSYVACVGNYTIDRGVCIPWNY